MPASALLSPPRGRSEMSCMVMITTRGSDATPLTNAPNWW
jgi:hypothetical protein